MKPYPCLFKNCGHTLTLRSWQASSKPCPLCDGIKYYMRASGFMKLELDNADILGKAAALSMVGAKEGGYRRPETVFKEMYGKDKETLSLWLTVGGSGTPQWVRDCLEGSKPTKSRTSWAEAAYLLGKDLEAAFPDCKVTSKSSAYSGGCSVRAIVRAKDPARTFSKEDKEKASDLGRKYEAGHFDGMNDIYVYHEKKDPSIPTVSYAFVELCNYSSDEEGG